MTEQKQEHKDEERYVFIYNPEQEIGRAHV